MNDQHAVTTPYSDILKGARLNASSTQEVRKVSIYDEESLHAAFMDLKDCTDDGAVTSRIKELVTRSFILGCVKSHSSKVLAERRVAKEKINTVGVDPPSDDTLKHKAIDEDQAKSTLDGVSVHFLEASNENEMSCIQDEELILF